LDVELENGVTSVREVIRHPGATGILAQLPDGRFVLVEQYRKPAEKRLLEIVAGTLEPGEAPEACARREVREETGYDVASLKLLGRIFLAPGYSDECLHLFWARLAAVPGAAGPDEDERVEVRVLSEAELEAAMDAGGIEDAKTLAAWCLWRRRKT